MPTKTLRLTLKDSPEKVLTEAAKLAHQYQVQYSGDAHQGQFSIRGFEGSYQIVGQELTITMHQMPPGVPWFLVEAGIKRYLG